MLQLLPSTGEAEETVKRLPGAPRMADVVNHDGVAWQTFRRALKPRYAMVWRDIALCYAMWAGGFALHVAVCARWGNAVAILAAPLFATVIGYGLHALWLFGHEAGHHHLAANRSRNDRLGDWIVWPLFGDSTSRYRPSHWMHHKHLGDLTDTEVSYHNCLSPWFLFKTLSGIYLLEFLARTVLGRGPPATGRTTDNGADAANAADVSPRLPLLVRAMLLHLVLCGAPALWGLYGSSLTWFLSVIVAFPCFSAVRQILEHREIEADCATDFSRVEHGPLNRMFGGGLLTRYFGAAGFDRHLLHHWDPSVSYTRFDEMEAFLMNSPMADSLSACRTTYFKTFCQLVRSACRGGQR